MLRRISAPATSIRSIVQGSTRGRYREVSKIHYFDPWTAGDEECSGMKAQCRGTLAFMCWRPSAAWCTPFPTPSHPCYVRHSIPDILSHEYFNATLPMKYSRSKYHLLTKLHHPTQLDNCTTLLTKNVPHTGVTVALMSPVFGPSSLGTTDCKRWVSSPSTILPPHETSHGRG